MTGTKSKKKIVSTLSMSLRNTAFYYQMLSYAPLEQRRQHSLAKADMTCTNHLFLLIFYIKKSNHPLIILGITKKTRCKI
jgi:hypothetical protein